MILPSLIAIALLWYWIYYSSRTKKTRIKYKKQRDDLLKSGFTPDMNHTYGRSVMNPDAGDWIITTLRWTWSMDYVRMISEFLT